MSPPDMERLAPACGVATNPLTGDEEVILAGGSEQGNWEANLDPVSIYSVAKNEWRRGNFLVTRPVTNVESR